MALAPEPNTNLLDPLGLLNQPAATATPPKVPAAAPNSLSAFAQALLKGLKMPVTQANVNFILSWAHREGGGGAFNPLNTTQRISGSTSFNSVGVQNYRSVAEGVAATLKTLQNGRYGDILAGLKTGRISPTQEFKGLGTWSGGGYTNLTGIAPAPGMVQTKARVSTSATTTDIGGLGKNATDKQVLDEINKHYGYMATFMKDPEVRKIMLSAVREGWADDSARMQGALSRTKFWKTHSDVTRNFDAQGRLDPASQKAAISGQITLLQAQAKRMGLILDPKRLSQMAVNSLRFGWNDQQIRNGLVSEGKFDLTGKTGSSALTLRDNLKARASDFLVPVDNKTLMQWVGNVEKGTVSEQDFDGYLKEQAKSLFPTMGAAIDAGVTPKTYVAPYANIAADTLEIDPSSVQFTDPKWSKALFQVDPKTKERSAMGLADWQTLLRTDPSYGYDQTQQAKQQASALTTQLAKTFGAL